MRIRNLVLSVSLLAAASVMAMDERQAERAYEVRHSLFTLVGWNIGPLAGMAKQEIPFDAEQAELHASRIASLVPMIPDAFVADTRGFELDTEAKDAIWEDKEDFLRLAENVREKSIAVKEAAATGELDTFTGAFVEMGQACKDCHDKYRED